jgi:hypothetical protein
MAESNDQSKLLPGVRALTRLLGPLLPDVRGASMMETVLLVGAIAIPSMYIMKMALDTLVEHYRMITLVNSLPFP